MAMQLHKDSKEITTNDVTPEVGVDERHQVSNSGLCQLPPTNNRNNLQALLNLSTSLQNSSSTDTSIGQMDNEKEQFLNGVLKSLTTDVVGHLKTLIRVATETEGEEREEALEELLDHVCCIDIAKCFYQLDGLNTIKALLKNNKCEVRRLSARLISECCQNNPYCQQLTDNEVFSSLIDIAKNDEDHTTRFYAFSAISAIVRDNPEGLAQFKKNKGCSVLRDGLKILNTRMTAKISFLISYLSQLNDETRDDLVEASVVLALIEAITTSNDIYPVQALLSLMSNSSRAVEQTCQHGSALTSYIKSTLDENYSEADRELVECCSKIGQLMDGSGK